MCSKVQAIYICKLASQGWSAEEHKGLKKDDLKCIGTLCNKNVGRCCEKRKELMGAPTYLPAEDMPLDDAGVANFKKYDIDRPAPIHVNEGDKKPSVPDEPVCPTGNIDITFGDFKVKAYVPRGRKAGDVFEEECGYKALDPKKKFKLVCQDVSGDLKMGDLKWQLAEGQEGLCEEKRGCDPANFQVTLQVEGKPEWKWPKLKFNLPFQENKFGKKVGFEIPCPKDKDIVGGHMQFYCNPNGKWSSGEQKCKFSTPMAPVEQPTKPDKPDKPTGNGGGSKKPICKKAKFNVEVNGKRLAFELPEGTENGEELKKDCGSNMCGEITFECDETVKQWSVGSSSCKQKGVCQPTNFGVSMSFGQVKFKLPLKGPGEKVTLPCKAPAASGNGVFECKAQEDEDDECEKYKWALDWEGTTCSD